MTPAELLDHVRGQGLDVAAKGEGVALVGPQTLITPDLLAMIRPHKAALLDVLRTLPTFSVEDERALVDHYTAQPRAQRLAIHNRGKELHAAGLPWREADLSAMREHLEAAR